MISPPHVAFRKIPRWSRDIVITEKIDGTNACIYIAESGLFLTGSRNRWTTPDDDNYGFSKWAHERQEELLTLGKGFHWGEWWGQGIQRGYGITEKRFSLFNVSLWRTSPVRPPCCSVVPVIYSGPLTEDAIREALERIQYAGSYAAPGFQNPEGIVIFHTASGHLYKKTCKDDEKPKGTT